MAPSTLADIEARLARLERGNRYLCWALGATVATCAVLLFSLGLRTHSVTAQQAPQVVTATRFELQDPRTGTPRGGLEVDPDTGAAVFWVNAPADRIEDATWVSIVAGPGAADFYIIHGPTQSKVLLGTTANGAGQLIIRDANGTPVFEVPEGSADPG